MKKLKYFILPLMAILLATTAWASEELKPFTLASKSTGNKDTVTVEAISKLTTAGFEVVGQHSPYDNVNLVIITNDKLKSAAARSEYGAYAAAQRVSVTDHNGEIQVAYTNPVYMAHAYRLEDTLEDVDEALRTALGSQSAFGPEEGLVPKKLRKYHYMFGMPYVDDPDELAEYDSHEQAVNAVEQGLAAGNSGTSKVYRIDMGDNKVLFGVAMTKGDSSDEYIMSEIDFKDIRSSAHLPYEMLVDGNEVYALNARFRIAINFPDLKMMGSNSFMNIMSAPGAIRSALAHAAGKSPEGDGE
jgi:hypothetical protein